MKVYNLFNEQVILHSIRPSDPTDLSSKTIYTVRNRKGEFKDALAADLVFVKDIPDGEPNDFFNVTAKALVSKFRVEHGELFYHFIALCKEWVLADDDTRSSRGTVGTIHNFEEYFRRTLKKAGFRCYTHPVFRRYGRIARWDYISLELLESSYRHDD